MLISERDVWVSFSDQIRTAVFAKLDTVSSHYSKPSWFSCFWKQTSWVTCSGQDRPFVDYIFYNLSKLLCRVMPDYIYSIYMSS